MQRHILILIFTFLTATQVQASAEKDLLEAIKQMDLEGVKTAVRNGADLNKPLQYEATPLMAAVSYSPSGSWEWTRAEKQKLLKTRIAVVKYLVSHKADVHYKTKSNWTILSAALSLNDSPYELIELLVSYGVKVDTFDNRDVSPVDICIGQGFPRELKLLLAHNGSTKNSLALYVATGDFEKLKDANLTKDEINRDYWYIRGALLTIAVRFDQYNIAKYLISKGAKIDIANAYGPVLHACIKAQPRMLELLLQSGANFEIENYSKDRPLHNAASWCGVSCVKLLLEKGANPNIAGHVEQTPLFSAVERDDFESAKLLIKYGADVNAQNGTFGPAIFPAIKHERFDIVELLLQNGQKIDALDWNGSTLFYVLAKKKRFDIIETLRQKGLNLSWKSQHKLTYLMEFSKQGNLEAIEYLLRYKPDIAAESSHWEAALSLAIKEKHLDIAKILIKYANPIRTYKDEGCSALVVSIEQDLLDISEILLKRGVSPNHKCHYGFNALHQAAINGNVQAIELLLRFGAKLDIQTYQHKVTALHLAIYKNQSKSAQYLIASGANVYLRDYEGKSAISLAKEKQMTEIIIMLKEKFPEP